MSGRNFSIKQSDAYSDQKKIQAGVAQGNELRPIRYLFYSNDQPTFNLNVVTTFADDTATLVIGGNSSESTGKLQTAIDQVQR